MDPAVCRAKFEAEVASLEAQAAVLRSWGCWISRASFPTIDLVFVPRNFIRLSLPTRQLSLLAYPNRVQPPPVALLAQEMPMAAARAFGVRVGLDDYDQRAPSVTFCDPWTWIPLPAHVLPLAQTIDDRGRSQLVLINEHPATHRPFLCLRGIREYHEHPQHTGDDWQLYRGDMGAFSLVTAILRTCVDVVRPNFVINPPELQVRWEAEKK